MNYNTQIDSTDWKILEELQEDARLTYSELGRRVQLSQPAVSERVRRLEEAGIIEGYHATVNRELLGRPITAFMRMRVIHPQECQFTEMIQTMSIVTIDALAGA